MRVYLFLIPVILLTTCVQKTDNDDQHVKDVAAINQLREQEETAAEAGNVEALLLFRTDDFIAMPPNQPAIEGKEAVRAFLTGMLGQMQMEETVVSEEIVVSGDWAFDRGTFTGSATPKGGGETMTIDGKYLWILERQPNGSWKYTVQMWSNNGSPSSS